MEFLREFCTKAGLPDELIARKAPLLLSEIKSSRRGQLQAYLSFLEKLERYDFSAGTVLPRLPQSPMHFPPAAARF